ncbi:hypothetical protein BX600DRAFT_518832 [Xylariales sp. PMI_506]|nr:hypothetical protein BX600DRAFT_518832 [Xylariales sp. PMI_506]
MVFSRLLQGLVLGSGLTYALPNAPGVQKRAPQISFKLLGTTTTNLPNIYRDGGGSGTVDGQNIVWFSDGLYTSGGLPAADGSNVVNFTSNSIAITNAGGQGITSLQDFGTTEKGPYQSIPFYYDNGETDSLTGIWPNQNLVTLCDGACAVGFPVVVNRTLVGQLIIGDLYNTGVEVRLTPTGPVSTRPVQGIFDALVGEPLFGSFCVYAEGGYLYMFAKVAWAANPASNGIKLARVPQDQWDDKSAYTYWDGQQFGSEIPAFDDGGGANIISINEVDEAGTNYGPNAGDIWWSELNDCYILMYQMEDANLDSNVWMSYSDSMTGGWSTPVAVYQLTSVPDTFSYSFHVMHNVDPTGKTLPIMWTAYTSPSGYLTAIAEATFS